MKKAEYEKLRKNMYNALHKLEACTDSLVMKLQPYFKDEIHIFYQPSDGFVVLILDNPEKEGLAPTNIPIDDVFETIKEDPKYYQQ